jgi:AcrR family transcriptional regulator
MSQLGRIRRIGDAAGTLAEKGGFEGVRLRDVAEASGVSLGTLYKYFRSKEDILLFAVNEEGQRLEAVIASRPPAGDEAGDRMAELFGRATRGLTRRPNFARAALRSIASGDASMAAQQASFHLRTSRMVIATLRGEAPDVSQPLSEPVGTAAEQQIALVLEHVWFASLLGWASGLHPAGQVSERMAKTAALLLEGPGRLGA